ncbi:putative nicotinate-nucleotide adenylyltransferase [Paraliobacillus sp. PM-2]|uniref:bis(5'-nucleosyl)-tetraphosphatase (symmetrical) YqeK n=1 Tax=Paraliobacillus sp. PM-2 TaxID=1462524 RepID=UPI00061CB4C7|nr:bis(5'-nucleosyl)-tetraphosphatase (symmetrical) YqeK [Paraliobacillus sp. PM-2]CQR46912.1 putative nicotinate-nucleotide adenylyltransferase [Paraliobacillus sp. PM-2]
MNRQSALEIVKKQLNQSRYEHTIRVTDVALKLAEHYQVDQKKVEMAAIFHDYAKYRDKSEMQRIITYSNLPKDLLGYHPELWHGPVGAMLVRQEVGIEDAEVLNGIYWHTTGKVHMSMIEKIVFLADYIEPERDFPGLDEVRKQAWQNLDKACFLALQNIISFLAGRQQLIYPDTVHAYNYFNTKTRGVD